MKNKKTKIIFLILLMILGIAAIVFGLSNPFSDRENANLSGLMFGLGAGLIGASFSQLATIRLYSKNPKLLHKKTIEVTDERNTTIRNKAKGKVYDIYNVIFPIMIFGLAVAKVSFALTGLMLAVYGLRTILYFVYVNKYNKEM